MWFRGGRGGRTRKKAPQQKRLGCRGNWRSKCGSGVGRDDLDSLVDLVNGPVDMAKGALLEALGKGIIFLAGDILMRLLEQFFGAMESARVVHAGVDWRMVVEILAVVDGGLLDFGNGGVDFANGFSLLVS